jgi:hypothetical protein
MTKHGYAKIEDIDLLNSIFHMVTGEIRINNKSSNQNEKTFQRKIAVI